jgi:hypothetical protein
MATNNGATERKWDWDVIEALYLGGMELSQIRAIPRYRELSANFLAKRCSEKRWKDKREAARAEGTGEIARPLIEKMGLAEETHQHWLLDRMAAERNIFDKTATREGGKAQLERLAIIERIDATVRRQLGLDEKKPLSDQQRNLGILIHINGGGGPRKKGEGQTIAIAVQQQPTQPAKPAVSPELQAKLEDVFREIQEEEEAEKAPRPFRIKGEDQPAQPLVNENPPDVIEVLEGAGYRTVVINEGDKQ